MKYSEDTLKAWTAPLSTTEEQRVENTEKMIKDALSASLDLRGCSYEVFAQGSYANNTNVRNGSDIDICAMLTSTFYDCYPDGKTRKDYGFSEGTMEYRDYKNYVLAALKAKFGASAVTEGNKSIKISENSYHVNADVVPAFEYRDYRTANSTDPARYYSGIKFFDSHGNTVINYPKLHIQNGRTKNVNTGRDYKRLVRIMKNVRLNMIDDGKIDKDKITSFLTECLVWNVPNSTITQGYLWSAKLQNAIAYLWNSINDGNHKEWGEVSERLYLFHSGRKWTAEDAKSYLYNMYQYLEF